MRRLIIILLLIVYPFQVVLAMADRCCAMTSSGLTHHGTAQGPATAVAEPMFLVDDDRSALTDPHCPACSFAHHSCLPPNSVELLELRHDTERIDSSNPFPTSPPVLRLERPKWLTAAN